MEPPFCCGVGWMPMETLSVQIWEYVAFDCWQLSGGTGPAVDAVVTGRYAGAFPVRGADAG
jgi:hypothetical protein